MDSPIDNQSTGSNHKWLIVLLAVLPLAFLILFLIKYRTEAPVADEWALVPLVGKSYDGTLQLKDLWNQHNEHRQIFGRMILISLIRLSHWTNLYEVLVNVLWGIAIFIGALVLLKKTETAFQMNLALAIPAISMMIFSLNQSENWFWGFNMPILMDVAGVTLGLVIMGISKLSWFRAITAAVLGIVSTYSFANGVVFWPIGLILLWRKTTSSADRWKFLAFWLVLSTLVIVLYLNGYHKPSHHPSPFHFLEDPFLALNFVCTYLGAPLVAFCRKSPVMVDWLSHQGFIMPSSLLWLMNNASFFAGAAGLVLFCLAYFRLKNNQSSDVLLIFMCLSFYSIASAALSAIGRSAWGVQSALSLRYVTISTPFWFSILTLLFVMANPHPEKDSSKSFVPKLSKICIGVILLFLFLNSIYGALYAVKYHNFLLPAQQELLRMQDDHLLRRLYPSEDYIKRSITIMKRHRLSVFKDGGSSI